MTTGSSAVAHARRRLAHLTLSALLATLACLFGTSPASAAGWARVTSVNSGVAGNHLLAVSATSATDIWTVGWTTVTSRQQTLAEHSTNGTSWAIVTTPTISTTSDIVLAGVVAVSAADVWAVGYIVPPPTAAIQPLIEHSTGGSFALATPATLGTAFGQQLNAVYASSATDAWAVGQGPAGGYIQHWNGTTWALVTSATADFLTGVSGTGPSDVWAVGTLANAPFAEHWNGTAWSVPATPPAPTGTSGSSIAAVTAITASDVWMVGYGNLLSTNANQTLTEHWTGAAWAIVASLNIGSTSISNTLNGVSASSSADVWAVGVTTGASSNNQSLAEHWTGAAWSLSTPANPCTTKDVTMNAVESITSANVWSVGETACPTGSPHVTLTFQYTSVVTCTGGSLTLTSPATAAFGTVTLNGSDQTTTGNLAFTASDMTGSGAGWAISGTSTQFIAGGNTLPTTASAVTASSAVDPGGNCALPVNTIGTPANLPAGVGPPTAAKLYNSTATHGKGPTTVTLTFQLSIPASTHIGTYASTWTFTIASGP